MGYIIMADELVYVLVRTNPGMLEDVVDRIKHLEGVSEISPVTGAYDIIVKIEGVKITTALGVVVKRLRKIEGIQSTETLISVNI